TGFCRRPRGCSIKESIERAALKTLVIGYILSAKVTTLILAGFLLNCGIFITKSISHDDILYFDRCDCPGELAGEQSVEEQIQEIFQGAFAQWDEWGGDCPKNVGRSRDPGCEGDIHPGNVDRPLQPKEQNGEPQ